VDDKSILKRVIDRYWIPKVNMCGEYKGVVGFIAIRRTHNPKKWSCYIAGVPGSDTDNDICLVVEHGTKLQPRAAVAMFPSLDIADYE